MRIRRDTRGENVVVETGPGESLPPVSLEEIQLKAVLVPVDFSECSAKAFRYAGCLAKQFAAGILLLHVVEVPPPEPAMVDTSQVNVALRISASERLTNWRNQLAAIGDARTLIRDGRAAEEIVRVAEEHNIDLIIVGTHGRTGWRRAFLGSTAEKVLRHAPCPVLVVREQERDFIAPDSQRT